MGRKQFPGLCWTRSRFEKTPGVCETGNISDYEYEQNPDIIITLHACDTATYFALQYAVLHNAKAILSVPCCQHEVNAQLDSCKNSLLQEKMFFLPF